MTLKNLNYYALRELRASPDIVKDVEMVARALMESGVCEVQLVGPITQELRAAMRDVTPAGMYVGVEVDYRISPAMYRFRYKQSNGKRVGALKR
jgi:hypothetical protein